MMIPRALKFVSYERVPSHLEAGWVVLIPNAAHHHQHYGIELAWLCACPVPGGFQVEDSPTHTERGEHERATSGV